MRVYKSQKFGEYFRFFLLLGAVIDKKSQQMKTNQNAIRRLRGFFEYNRSLLHAKPNFLGYDPIFPSPYMRPK
jgi:hypothetical protein